MVTARVEPRGLDKDGMGWEVRESRSSGISPTLLT